MSNSDSHRAACYSSWTAVASSLARFTKSDNDDSGVGDAGVGVFGRAVPQRRFVVADKSEKEILSEEEIDDLVESQADEDDVWDEPLSHRVTADFRQVVYGLSCEMQVPASRSDV
ncbi:MAG: hypothetical protein ACKVZH_07300 [Blastocatellia bacterium]